jgi:transcriptional regulator with PAS, ATPase and Fis domain
MRRPAVAPPAISKTAMQILLNYDYPGNVRELENILEHALIICREAMVQPDHLPDYVRQVQQTAAAPKTLAGEAEEPEAGSTGESWRHWKKPAVIAATPRGNWEWIRTTLWRHQIKRR